MFAEQETKKSTIKYVPHSCLLCYFEEFFSIFFRVTGEYRRVLKPANTAAHVSVESKFHRKVAEEVFVTNGGKKFNAFIASRRYILFSECVP